MQDREFAVVLEGIRNDFRAFSAGLADVQVNSKETKDKVHTISKKTERIDVRLQHVEEMLYKL